MTVKKIDVAALHRWVDRLISRTKVVGVKAREDHFVFAPLAKAADLRLDYDGTLLPPKKFIQPPVEDLLAWGKDGFRPSAAPDPFVLFGVHPYDLAAILQMDVFFKSGRGDGPYDARRAAATLIAVDAEKAAKNIFAASMGTAVVTEGFDILLTRIGEHHYLADIRTEKGRSAAAAILDSPDARPEDLAVRESVWEKNRKDLKRQELKISPENLPRLLEGAAENPVWEEKSAKCFSCGSCNLVCPTCYCFDVKDDPDWSLEAGGRRRLWDGCLLTEFALVSGGHNFRKTRKERYRHRFYRKGKYLHDRFGHISCVGCGRCVSACVANIANPVEVFNRLVEA